MTVSKVWHFINSNPAGITILISAFVALFNLWRWVNIQSKERRQADFENYHKLIKDLNQPDTPNIPIMLSRQVAVVFELRNYPKYASATKRILTAWLDNAKAPEHKVLHDEIQLTINYLNKNPLQRFWVRLCERLGLLV